MISNLSRKKQIIKDKICSSFGTSCADTMIRMKKDDLIYYSGRCEQYKHEVLDLYGFYLNSVVDMRKIGLLNMQEVQEIKKGLSKITSKWMKRIENYNRVM